ncbi:MULTISPECIES: hypothetical protein [Mycolicibacterium]|jgi:hypothetical protein|uniref:hypothetical protein n=1 Tax=Mycolicibacterium TaxID=1866885 RepID=UPI000979D9FC|nr:MULTISPECIES: hypothetical protein [Mycolicibacterium]OMB90211.1 hypothetical protein A5746_21655 [Mycolicibacterium conceptionense]QZH62235.1 hypothetical protein K1X22_11345 [Mycolicibacterium farcinogenes]
MPAIPNGHSERAAPLVVDQFDWEILEFVVAWAHYGGPSDEHTVPLFGMDAPRLLERFHEVVIRLGRGGHATLTFKQYKLFQRAAAVQARLVRDHQPSGPAKSDKRSAAELSATAGRWFQHQGVWHWQESEAPQSAH